MTGPSEPIVDWIGDIPVMHGERDVPHGHPDYGRCLCGHEFYLACPEWASGGIGSLVIGEPYGGRI